MRSPLRSPGRLRRARWVAPVAVAGAIALGSWVATTGTAGASTPDLPGLTAAQILAKATHPTTSAWSGTVTTVANLGLPDVSSLEDQGAQGAPSPSGFDPTTLLSGTHHFQVWENGDDQRIALASELAETDLVHAGNQAWLYDSSTDRVTHWIAPAPSGTGEDHQTAGDHQTDQTPMTPVEWAQRFLDHLGPSTDVTVTTPVYVAHRAAYDLTLSPKAGTPGAADSTIRSVSLSVDAATGLPLCVAMDARGQSAPALMIQFSSLHLGTPSASNFAAPHGATTRTETLHPDHPTGHDGDRPHGHPTVTGAPWAQVLTGHVRLGRDTRQLDRVSTAVDGARLVHSAVANALVFPDGRVVAGFVTPAALEAAAG